MRMLQGIATGTPIWVWPLLAVLIVIGFYSMRERVSPIWAYYLIPLMGVFAVNAVAGIPAAPEIWGLFVASYLVGALGGYRVQPRWIIWRRASRVALRGEALTLVVILTVFAANFVIGTLQAVAPQVVASTLFQAGFVMVEGLASGSFLGRTLAIVSAPVETAAMEGAQ